MRVDWILSALTCLVELDELVVGHPELIDEELRVVVAAAT